jgi:hypothetical protein
VTEFNLGTRVRLRYAPAGAPGTIIGTWRGKVEVRWPDLGALTTKHRTEALTAEVTITRTPEDIDD